MISRGSGIGYLLSLALLVMAGSAPEAGSPPHCYGLETAIFSNLTGAPGFSASTVDSSLQLLIRQAAIYRILDRKGKTSITDIQCRRIDNPIALSIGDHEPCDVLHMEVDLEQVLYGRVGEDVKNGLIGYAMFGNMALGAPGSMGQDGAMIQYRVRIWSEGHQDTVSAIGIGVAVGRIEKLSRRQALAIADRRALQDLAGAAVEQLNDDWKLGARSRVVSVTDKEFAQRADGW